MRVLATGGAGFIGSHLVDRLVDEHEVYVIDDLSGGYKRNLNPKIKDFYQLDLRSASGTKMLIEKIKPEVIYHLAANAAENKAQFSPIDVTSRNWNTFINVLTTAINNGLKRFVFTSSIAVYGDLEPPFSEDDRPEPEDLYGITKYAIEMSLKVMSEVHDFEYVIVRPHNVYGPRQNMSDPYRNVVTIFMNALLKGERYFIYGDGKQERCFSYIDEVADSIYRAGVYDGVSDGVFNVGADRSYTLNELSDTIQKVSGVKIKPKRLPDRPQEVKIATASHDNAEVYLDYVDETPLEVGIAKTWEYCQKLGPQRVFKGMLEIQSKKLPGNW